MVILSSFIHGVEFYVIASFLAAAVIGLCARRPGRGPALTMFSQGTLSSTPATEASITVCVNDDCSLTITRRGYSGLLSGASVALAITRIGFDLSIEERIVPSPDGYSVNTATFTIAEALGSERYHVRYNSEPTGLFSAFTLPVRPGITITKPMM
ncbi:MAG: hypothetical protein NC043_01870 [Muribaculaceae bacterium]|nr:hypothetical protein [Muribaculaceae bacterium]